MVASEHSEPDCVADADRPDVPDPHRGALLGGDDDVLHVTRGLDEADAAHRDTVLATLDEAAAGVRVVVRDGVEHLLQRQVIGAEPDGVDVDLILLGATARGHDVRYPGHFLESWRALSSMSDSVLDSSV